MSSGRASALAADRPNRGIYLGPAVWHTTRRFSPDCVILLLAAAPYDEADYLRASAALRLPGPTLALAMKGTQAGAGRGPVCRIAQSRA